MSRIAATIIFAFTSAAAFGATALADTTTSADPVKSASEPAVTTGSIDVEPTFEQRIQECMAVWDRGTHMTKAQWRRSCRTTLQSLSTE
ncbi:MAG: hypothetical protein WC829_24110 [Hyphomicrobium sp.]|jgi:hypothetical protein